MENLKNTYCLFVPEEVRAQIQKVRGLFSPKGMSEAGAAEDWVDRIEALQRSELGKLPGKRIAIAPGEKKKILVYSPIPWPQGGVEHLLSVALQLRGHDVKSVVCGGLLPDCEMHYYDFERPDCADCVKSALRYTNAFGIRPLLSTDFLDEHDIEEAYELVKGLPESELLALEYDGLSIGKVARFQIGVFYQTFLMELDEIQTEQFRAFCEAAILLHKFSKRLLGKENPDIVIECDGKAFMYRPLYLLARQKGISAVTWQEHAFDDTMKFVFNHNTHASEIHLEEIWPIESTHSLSSDQLGRLDEYFAKWRQAEITPFAYHQNTRLEVDYLYSNLGIERGTPIVACFPNMIRDVSAFERDVAFESLIDWIFQTVEFARSRPDLQFIIKAHPAERCLPEVYAKYNRFFVCEEVAKHFSPVPQNVHLVEGDSPINTYTLMQLADVIIVYTSTVGIECALEGRMAIVVGDVHYRDKGFTKDISHPEELWEFLNSGPPYSKHISSHQIDLAKRYAYLWRFRHPVVMPFYDPNHRAFSLPSFKAIIPGGDPVIERLCQCIVTGKPFMDINEPERLHS